MQDRTNESDIRSDDHSSTTPETVDEQSAEHGIEWNDEDGTVLVRRLAWMSDAQWRIMRDGMVAHFEAAGLIRCPR